MLAQYANSPKLVSLVQGLQSQFDNAKTIEDWFRIVFDLRTATGFGLDIWGKILNQGRRFEYVDENQQVVKVYLQGAQTVGGVDYTAEQMDEFYRTALFLKAFSYISDCSLKNMNNLLYFYSNSTSGGTSPDKKAYAYNVGTMAIEIVFEFFMPKLEQAILTSDLFPTPAGVDVNYRFIPKGAWLGFFEAGKTATEQPFAPFDHKPFYPYGS